MLKKIGNNPAAYLFSLVIALYCFPTVIAAQDISFSVTADRTEASLGEQIQVTAQVQSNKQLPGSFAPQVPKSEDFDVMSTNRNQSQSQSINIINGKMTQTVNITYLFYYTIAPKRAGTFTFPALTCSIDGATYTSNSFAISIGKEAAPTTDVRVSLIPSKKSLYPGEQVILGVKVMQKAGAPVQLHQQGLAGLYDKLEKNIGKDFAVLRLFNQIPSNGAGEVINGEKYFVVQVQYALFPLTNGVITVPGIPFEYIGLKQAQGRRRGDPFEDFFGDGFFGGAGVQQIPKNTVSNSVTFQVNSLPEKPAHFDGAVGTFSMSSSISPKEVAAGDAVTLSVAIHGNTRPGSMGDITMPSLADCEFFPPEKRTTVDTTKSGITSTKTCKYLLVPRQEGSLVIPAITWTYFDPAAKTYKTLSTEATTLIVTKGKAGQATQTRYLTQEEIRLVGQDIRYIKTSGTLSKQTDKPYRNPLFFFLYPIPFLIALFSFLYKFQSERYEKDAGLALKKKALKTAEKSLNILRKKAEAAPSSEFLGVLASCLEDFMSHKYGFAATGKTLDDLKQELINHGAKQETTDKISTFFESLDTYRFGMAPINASTRKELLEKTATLIRELASTKKGSAS
jgi:hypothetical protein